MTGFRADFRNAGLIEKPLPDPILLKNQSPISNLTINTAFGALR